MNDQEVMEKYGISKKTMAGLVAQTVLLVIAFGISVVGIIRNISMYREMIFFGQAAICVALIYFCIFKFKDRDRDYLKIILMGYAFLEAIRAALLNTSGINPAIAGLARFVLVVLAICYVLIAERIDKKDSERLALAMVVLEVALYLIFIFGFPGMMYGRLNRIYPIVGVLISGSIAIFLKAKFEQLGAEEDEISPAQRWRSIIVIVLSLVIVISSLVGVSIQHANDVANGTVAPVQGDDPLSYWTDDAPLKAELVSYIEAVTDKENPDYIPVERRIAVFDLDGTLFCETDPNYFDYTMLLYRVTEDPSYKDKASDFEKEVAQKIQTLNETGEAAKGLEVDHGKAVASAFSGFTLDEFNDYIQEFKKMPHPGYEGMTRGEAFYKPMIQVVNYLRANDFTVYVVSGTDRFIVRGIVDNSVLKVPFNRIIGSDENLVAPDQGDTDGLSYVYEEDDKLVLGGQFIIKNLKMNKVTVIAQEIGMQPVLSFGNSSGDASMAEYVINNNPYKSLAFMLCCDDTERENGNVEKAEKMKASCEEYGWIPVSMKNDWTTIYGDNVTRKK